MPVGKGKFFISFDVWRLFTSITFNETINIVVNLIFENKTRLCITKNGLKKSNEIFAISGPHFLFFV